MKNDEDKIEMKGRRRNEGKEEEEEEEGRRKKEERNGRGSLCVQVFLLHHFLPSSFFLFPLSSAW